MLYYSVHFEIGPEGPTRAVKIGGSSPRHRTGGSNPSRETEGFSLRHRTGGSTPSCDTRGSSLRRMNKGSMLSYSHERLIICVCGILGNSLRFVLTVLCDMCFRYLSRSREDADLIVHTRHRYVLRILDCVFKQLMNMCF